MMGHAWLKHREALLALVIILMIGAIGSRAPSFVSPGNLVEMFNDTAILIILALGQMMVLLTKGIDLSMAANLALTGMIVALLNAHYPGIPVVALLALATLLGLLMGVINGLLVWRLGIPAIVVTLGTMSIYRGIIFLLTDGGWVNSHQALIFSVCRAALPGAAATELVRHRRAAAGGLFPALQPHRPGLIHRGRQRDGGILHRH